MVKLSCGSPLPASDLSSSCAIIPGPNSDKYRNYMYSWDHNIPPITREWRIRNNPKGNRCRSSACLLLPMEHRCLTTVCNRLPQEQRAKQIMYELATKIPKVKLCRIEEKFPSLRAQIHKIRSSTKSKSKSFDGIEHKSEGNKNDSPVKTTLNSVSDDKSPMKTVNDDIIKAIVKEGYEASNANSCKMIENDTVENEWLTRMKNKLFQREISAKCYSAMNISSIIEKKQNKKSWVDVSINERYKMTEKENIIKATENHGPINILPFKKEESNKFFNDAPTYECSNKIRNKFISKVDVNGENKPLNTVSFSNEKHNNSWNDAASDGLSWQMEDKTSVESNGPDLHGALDLLSFRENKQNKETLDDKVSYGCSKKHMSAIKDKITAKCDALKVPLTEKKNNKKTHNRNKNNNNTNNNKSLYGLTKRTASKSIIMMVKDKVHHEAIHPAHFIEENWNKNKNDEFCERVKIKTEDIGKDKGFETFTREEKGNSSFRKKQTNFSTKRKAPAFSKEENANTLMKKINIVASRKDENPIPCRKESKCIPSSKLQRTVASKKLDKAVSCKKKEHTENSRKIGKCMPSIRLMTKVHSKKRKKMIPSIRLKKRIVHPRKKMKTVPVIDGKTSFNEKEIAPKEEETVLCKKIAIAKKEETVLSRKEEKKKKERLFCRKKVKTLPSTMEEETIFSKLKEKTLSSRTEEHTPFSRIEEEFPCLMMEEETPSLMMEEETLSSGMQEETPSCGIGEKISSGMEEETPSLIMEEETPSLIMEEETPSLIMEEETLSLMMEEKTLMMEEETLSSGMQEETPSCGIGEKISSGMEEETPSLMMEEETSSSEMGEETPSSEMGEETPSSKMGEETPSSKMGEETPSSEMEEETLSLMMEEETSSSTMGEETPSSGMEEETLSVMMEEEILTSMMEEETSSSEMEEETPSLMEEETPSSRMEGKTSLREEQKGLPYRLDNEVGKEAAPSREREDTAIVHSIETGDTRLSLTEDENPCSSSVDVEPTSGHSVVDAEATSPANQEAAPSRGREDTAIVHSIETGDTRVSLTEDENSCSSSVDDVEPTSGHSIVDAETTSLTNPEGDNYSALVSTEFPANPCCTYEDSNDSSIISHVDGLPAIKQENLDEDEEVSSSDLFSLDGIADIRDFKCEIKEEITFEEHGIHLGIEDEYLTYESQFSSDINSDANDSVQGLPQRRQIDFQEMIDIEFGLSESRNTSSCDMPAINNSSCSQGQKIILQCIEVKREVEDDYDSSNERRRRMLRCHNNHNIRNTSETNMDSSQVDFMVKFPRHVVKSMSRTRRMKRDLRCKTCSKAFDCAIKLEEHIRLHLPDFKCNVCEQAFICDGALRGHMRVHLGERPYDCNVCKNLKKHRHRTGHHSHQS